MGLEKINNVKHLVLRCSEKLRHNSSSASGALRSLGNKIHGEISRESKKQIKAVLKLTPDIPDSKKTALILRTEKNLRQRAHGVEFFQNPAQAALVEIKRQQLAHDIFFNLNTTAANLLSSDNTYHLTNVNSKNILNFILSTNLDNNTHYQLGATRITVKANPTEHLPFNFYMPHIGKYGQTNKLDILSTLKEFSTLTEMPVAELMKKFEENRLYGDYFAIENYPMLNPKKHAALINKMNRILLLVNVKEIYRLFHHDFSNELTPYTSHYPIGFTINRSLKLVELGEISLNDVFDKNAPYSPMTGTCVTLPQNKDLLFEKIERVNAHFNKSVLYPRMQTQSLLKNFGGTAFSLFPHGYITELSQCYNTPVPEEILERLREEEDKLYGVDEYDIDHSCRI